MRLTFLLCVLLAKDLTSYARTRPHYGGNVHVQVEGDPLEIDRTHRPQGIAWRLMLDGLTRVDDNDPQDAVQPALATRWTSDNNNHRWQFWLRPGVSFHSGKPLTAPAVVTSIEESCRMVSCPWTAMHIVGQSVVFLSDAAVPDMPAVLARSEFLIRQAAEPENGGTATIVGTGPFRMSGFENGMLHLEANDECWQGRPFVDSIEIASRRSEHYSAQGPASAANAGGGRISADVIELAPNDIRSARTQHLNVAVSSPTTLLALEIRNGTLAPQLRGAMALAVDRNALYQVIFQKQGELTASLLPASLSGYSFLFPVDRELTHALELRGGVTPPPMTLAYDGSGAIQLAAERLALNLHDAGFAVRVLTPVSGSDVTLRADLVLRTVPLEGAQPTEALDWMLRSFAPYAQTSSTNAMLDDDPATAYRVEHDFLEQHTVIPLLYLPRAWVFSSRLRDVRIDSEGAPALADVSLEDTQ
jgi:MarR-like DNA-binding transcriptional regulator SgrR of sgrS sRNA